MLFRDKLGCDFYCGIGKQKNDGNCLPKELVTYAEIVNYGPTRMNKEAK